MLNKDQSRDDGKNRKANRVENSKRNFLKKAGVVAGGLTFGSASLSSSASAVGGRSRGRVRIGQNTHVHRMNRGSSGNDSPAIALDAGVSDASVGANRARAAVNVAPFPIGGVGKSVYSAWVGYKFIARGNRPQIAEFICRGSVDGYLEAAGPASAGVHVAQKIEDLSHNRRVGGGFVYGKEADLLTIDLNGDDDNHLDEEVHGKFRKKHTVHKLQPGHVYRVSYPLRAVTKSRAGEAASNFHPDAEGLTGIFRGSGVGPAFGGEGGQGLKIDELLIRFPCD